MQRWLALAVLCLVFAISGCRGVLGIEPATKAPDEAGAPDIDAGCKRDDACPAGDECMHYACMSGGCQQVFEPLKAACGAGGACDGQGACLECEPDSMRCSSNDAVQKCSSDGKWGAAEACTMGVCMGTSCTTCRPRETKCLDVHRVEECSMSGEWMDAHDCANQACDGNLCKGQCSPGQKRCETANSVSTCNDHGAWPSAGTTCQYACLEDTRDCGGECVPGADECMGGSTRHCGAKGKWSALTACPSDCQNSHCTTCAPHAVECLNHATQRRTCNQDGTWGDALTCLYGCENGQCKPCQPNDTECVGAGQMRTCKPDGQWDDTLNCPLQCANKKCRVCTPGALECDPNARDYRHLCDANGQWNPSMACAMRCKDGACVECDPSVDTPVCTAEMMVKSCQSGSNTFYTEGCRAHAHCQIISPTDVCPCDTGYSANISEACVLPDGGT
jgi:hypothetical protein